VPHSIGWGRPDERTPRHPRIGQPYRPGRRRPVGTLKNAWYTCTAAPALPQRGGKSAATCPTAPPAAVSRVLDGQGPASTSFPPSSSRSPKRSATPPPSSRNSPERLKAWWVYRMLFTPNALRERLALMWHKPLRHQQRQSPRPHADAPPETTSCGNLEMGDCPPFLSLSPFLSPPPFRNGSQPILQSGPRFFAVRRSREAAARKGDIPLFCCPRCCTIRRCWCGWTAPSNRKGRP